MGLITPLAKATMSSSGSTSEKIQYWEPITFLTPMDPEFGAKGDGVTDDTLAVQAAWNAGIARGLKVQGNPGAIYLVSKQGTTFNGYSLMAKDGLRWDGKTSTIKLANNQHCSVIINEHVNGNGSDLLSFVGGYVDGNQIGQSRYWSSSSSKWYKSNGGAELTYTPTILFLNLTSGSKVTDTIISNAYICGCCIQTAGVGSIFERLIITSSWGDGYSFVLDNCSLDEIYAWNISGMGHTPQWGSNFGQGILVALYNCTVGKVYTNNCRCPSKIQSGSHDVTWNLFHATAGPLTGIDDLDAGTSTWWGLKIQGDASGTSGFGAERINHNKRIHINEIVCDASSSLIDNTTQRIAAGLYIVYSDDIYIDKYIGIDCGRGNFPPECDYKDWADIKVHNCPRLTINSINCIRSNSTPIMSQLSEGDAYPTDVITISEINIVDPQTAFRPGSTTGWPGLWSLDGVINVGRMRITESINPPLVSGFGYVTIGATAVINIGEILIDRDLTIDSVHISLPDEESVAHITVGNIRKSDIEPVLTGTFTPIQGSVISIVDVPIYNWLELHSIVTASSSTLTPTAVSFDVPVTGLMVEHEPAGANDQITWSLEGYTSLTANAQNRSWHTLSLSTKPSARKGAAMCYIPTLSLTLLHGGYTIESVYTNDLWGFNHITRTWSRLSPATTPPRRGYAKMCYDSTRDRVMVSGGYGPSGTCSDLVEYYNGDWHTTSPLTTPPAGWTDMVFDSTRGVAVIYSGTIWEYDVTATTPNWINTGISLTNQTVSPRLVFDGGREVTVFYGGTKNGVTQQDTYEWNGTSLVEYLHSGITDLVEPTVETYAFVWDSNRDHLAITCCYQPDGGDIHVRGYERIGIEWIRRLASLPPTNVYPYGRYAGSGAFCPVTDEIIVFGGATTNWNAESCLDETLLLRR